MLRKYWPFHILFVVLVCVYALCPLFCEAFRQILCANISEKMQMTQVAAGSTCCHKTQTDTTDKSEIPSKSETVCCLNGLKLILPDSSYNADAIRESLTQHLVFIDPFSAIVPETQEILQYFLSLPKLSSSLFKSDISRRGPPYNIS